VGSFFSSKIFNCIGRRNFQIKIENNQRNFLLKIIECKIMIKFIEKKMG